MNESLPPKNIDVVITKETISIDGDNSTSYKLTPYYLEKLLKEDSLPTNELIAYGFEIFHNIFSTEERRKRIANLLDLKDDGRLTITIKSNEPEIHNIPFEIFNRDRTETGFLLKKGNVSVVRNIPALDKKIIPAEPPIKILILISLPLNVYEEQPIDPLRELQNIYSALDDYIGRGLVEIDIEEKVNIPTVRDKLVHGHYHIVHFTGHGAKGGFLVVEDVKETGGRAKLLTADELKSLFEGSGVSLFYFDACQTAESSPYIPSLAYKIFKNIPSAYTIANLTSVYDTLAAEATRLIYEHLFKEETIENVLNDVRFKLNIDWWKPVIFGEAGRRIFNLKEEIKKKPKLPKAVARPARIIKNYIYRFSLVRQVSEKISGDTNHLVLHGIGGAGKSTLAVYLSEFFEGKFSHIVFIDFFKEDKIRTPEALLDKILDEFEIEGILKKEEVRDLHYIKKWKLLNERIGGTRWLLILDNLETIQDKDGIIFEDFRRLAEEILNTKTVFTIFTTRLKTCLSIKQPLEHTLEIGEYSDGEVNFLFNELSDEEKYFMYKNWDGIEEIAGHHPLFISEIVNKKAVAPAAIFKTENFNKVFEFYRTYFETNKEDIKKLFALEYPFSKTFLNHFFNPNFISLLTEKLLILKDLGSEHYQIYKVLQSYFKDDFKIEDTDITALVEASLALTQAEITVGAGFTPAQIIGAGLAPALSNFDFLNILSILITYHKKTQDKNIENTLLDVFIKLSNANFLNNTGFENIITAFEKTLETLKRDDEKIATTYNNLAGVYSAMGDYAKAVEYFEKALKISLSKLGADHPDTATTYNNLAAVYSVKGDHNKAIEYYEKALRISLSKLGADHPDTASTYNNLALVYSEKGDHNKAIEYYEKALKIALSRLGTDHPNTATIYHNLAEVYSIKGEYNKAIEYYEKALKISFSKLGETHPYTASTYNNLAGVYRAKGEYDKAIEYSEKALKIILSKLGEDHPNTAATYNNLAKVYSNKREYDRAIEYFEKALKIILSKLGEDHPNTATTYNNLALVYSEKGDHNNAIEYYEKALKIALSRLGTDHPNTAAIYNNLGLLYRDMRDYDKAVEYFEKALKISLSKLGEEHPDTATTYNNLALVYRAKGEYDKAIEYYEKALEISFSKLGETHPYTASTYNNLAGVYSNKKEYDKAIEYYEKGIRTYRQGKDYKNVFLNLPLLVDAISYTSNYLKLPEYIQEFLELFEIFMDKRDPVVMGIVNFFIKNQTFKRIGEEKLKKLLQKEIRNVKISNICLARFENFLKFINQFSFLSKQGQGAEEAEI